MIDKIQNPSFHYYRRMDPYSYDSKGQINFFHESFISVFPLKGQFIKSNDIVSKLNH